MEQQNKTLSENSGLSQQSTTKQSQSKKKNPKKKKESNDPQEQLNYSQSTDFLKAECNNQPLKVTYSSTDNLNSNLKCEEEDSQETKDSNGEENEETVLQKLNMKFGINLQLSNSEQIPYSEYESAQIISQGTYPKGNQEIKPNLKNLPKSPNVYQKESSMNPLELKQTKENNQQHKKSSSKRSYKLLEMIISNIITDELKLIPSQPKSPTLDQSINLSQYSDSNFESPLMNESQNSGLQDEDSCNFEVQNMTLNDLSTPTSDFSFNNSPIMVEENIQVNEYIHPIGKKLEFKESIEQPQNERKMKLFNTAIQQLENENNVPKVLQNLVLQRPKKQLEQFKKPSLS